MPQANINETARTVRVIRGRWNTLTGAQKLAAVEYVLNNWQDVPPAARNAILPRLLAYLLAETGRLRDAINEIDAGVL